MLLTNASLEFDLLLLTMKLGLIKGILSLLLLFFFFFGYCYWCYPCLSALNSCQQGIIDLFLL